METLFKLLAALNLELKVTPLGKLAIPKPRIRSGEHGKATCGSKLFVYLEGEWVK